MSLLLVEDELPTPRSKGIDLLLQRIERCLDMILATAGAQVIVNIDASSTIWYLRRASRNDQTLPCLGRSDSTCNRIQIPDVFYY